MPIGNAEPEGRPAICVTVGVGSVSSTAVTTKFTTASGAPGAVFTVMSAGTVSTGAVTSGAGTPMTVTVKEAGAEVLPVASLAVKVCVVMPIGNAEPEGRPAICDTVGAGSKASTAVTAKFTTADVAPGAVFTVMSAGTVSTGAVTSGVTVTDWVAVPILPDTSNADQVTSVVPSGKVAGASLVMLITRTLSVAVALPMATGMGDTMVSTETSAGGVTTGAMLSSTITVMVTVAGAETAPIVSIAV
jgi:hypothetical protein